MIAIAATHSGTQTLQARLLQSRATEARRQVQTAQELAVRLEQQAQEASTALQERKRHAQSTEREWLRTQISSVRADTQTSSTDAEVSADTLKDIPEQSVLIQSVEGYLNRYRLLASDTQPTRSELIRITA